MNCDITTIIPTLCESARKDSLLRSIRSIHAAASSQVRILVIVNGQRFDSGLLKELRARNDIEVIQVEKGSQTYAQFVGRGRVTSPYFSFLDDDDEYLPGALDQRKEMLEQFPLAAVAVTNGYRALNGVDHTLYSRMHLVNDDPLHEIFQENWLNDCNHLFRTTKVNVDLFEGAPSVLEWTWLGFTLAKVEGNVVASNQIGFRINDTPGSLSKSAHYLSSRVLLYRRMMQSGSPPHVMSTLRRRLCSAWHELAVIERASGNRLKALQAHLLSLVSHWSGLKYLSFSWRLILPARH